MTHEIDRLPLLRDTITMFDIAAQKSLGQHFLLDMNITRKIARAASPHDAACIIEIGPGPGGLTRALVLEGAKQVIAIEKDRRCIGALEQIAAAAPGQIDIMPADAMHVEIGKIGDAPRKIVANLPYNIATALLIQWLHEIYRAPGCIADMVLMFQREVAERITAEPGVKDYGRISVLTQWLCDVKTVLHLPPGAFSPPPKVESTVLHITPRRAPLFFGKIENLEILTAAAFGQRRKMLRVSLKQIWPDAEAKLKAAGIDPTARAENLTPQQFGLLVGMMG